MVGHGEWEGEMRHTEVPNEIRVADADSVSGVCIDCLDVISVVGPAPGKTPKNDKVWGRFGGAMLRVF